MSKEAIALLGPGILAVIVACLAMARKIQFRLTVFLIPVAILAGFLIANNDDISRLALGSMEVELVKEAGNKAVEKIEQVGELHEGSMGSLAAEVNEMAGRVAHTESIVSDVAKSMVKFTVLQVATKTQFGTETDQKAREAILREIMSFLPTLFADAKELDAWFMKEVNPYLPPQFRQ